MLLSEEVQEKRVIFRSIAYFQLILSDVLQYKCVGFRLLLLSDVIQ